MKTSAKTGRVGKMDKTKINITMNQSGNGLQIGHVETTKRMTVTEIITKSVKPLPSGMGI